MVQVGDRISLVKTNDPFTKLKRGDIGTVQRRWRNEASGAVFDMIDVSWDSGSNLSLILNKDEFVVVDSSLRQKIFTQLNTIEQREVERAVTNQGISEASARNRVYYGKYIEPLAKMFGVSPVLIRELMNEWGAVID